MKTHNIYHAFLITIGFILSPLSWWNDLVINVPLAYLLSYPFSIMDDTFFLTSFIFAYWFTNLLGLLMLHWSGEQLLTRKSKTFNVRHSIIVSVAYSIIMIIAVWLGWIKPPTELMDWNQ